MKSLLICFALILNTLADAQQWIWDSLTKPDRYDLNSVIDVFQQIYTFEAEGSTIQKCNPDGSALAPLNFPLNFNIRAIETSKDGFLYVVGTFVDTLIFDTHSLISYGDKDICILKLFQSGAIDWIKQIGSKKGDYLGDIALSDDRIYVSGIAGDTTRIDTQVYVKTDNPDFFIVAFDMKGQIQVAKFATSSRENYPWPGAGDLKIDNQGNVIAFFKPYGITQLDTVQFKTSYLLHILKFDPQLKLIWTMCTGEGGYGIWLQHLCINASNDLFFVKYSGSHYHEESNLLKVPSGGDSVQYIYRLQFSRIADLKINSCDELYFTGHTRLWNHAQNPPDINKLITGALTSHGTPVWYDEKPSNHYRKGKTIQEIENGKYFVKGIFQNEITLSSTLFSDGGGFNGIIQSTKHCNSVGLPESIKNSFAIYPNPTSGILMCDADKKAILTLKNQLGQVVLSFEVEPGQNKKDLKGLTKGLYFLVWDEETALRCQKVIIE